MKKLDFLYFDAGGGHRSAANGLLKVIADQQRPWEVRMVNLQELLDPLDVFRKVTGRRLQDLYNLMLKKGWTLGSPQLIRGMHLVLVARDLPVGNGPAVVETELPDVIAEEAVEPDGRVSPRHALNDRAFAGGAARRQARLPGNR